MNDPLEEIEMSMEGIEIPEFLRDYRKINMGYKEVADQAAKAIYFELSKPGSSPATHKADAIKTISYVIEKAIEQEVNQAADAWNRRVEIKLEWRGERPFRLHLGECVFGIVASDGYWRNQISKESGSNVDADQAKADCEASVRKSLKELTNEVD